jgi:hypothetical protein
LYWLAGLADQSASPTGKPVGVALCSAHELQLFEQNMDNPLVVAAALLLVVVLAGLGALMVYQTMRRRGKWGINLNSTVCARCQTPLPMVRRPTSLRQMLWGGSTCPHCGCEMDKWGRPLS